MMPYDGIGQGKSNYWSYISDRIATEKEEKCNCWDNSHPHYQIVSDASYPRNMCIKVVCLSEGCTSLFIKSTEALTQNYRDLYGIKG
jgi:hypothetical protein